jgi:hypothetical protein
MEILRRNLPREAAQRNSIISLSKVMIAGGELSINLQPGFSPVPSEPCTDKTATEQESFSI